ncbi:UDP-2,4-diacetamido-2,4,6-trideoxy-beta-L-altropyranose hydrolase [Colwellia ponticola]|uniref:UDP-2,4-diacetamido-2,4, 6-trideoxy-beta-L-altropyranose hydrolase n=1 Tax=Colwellia ponticola TaxID=2304625 RepID=A0A8H2JLA7_9GAMM|nr:UDP-2,4-diacetamido-2,4,6-trideoxy-beta-L-altropyranose hydrolase [Colwellia ponticola]TMM44957.1 UDP-2,4-diacetamido-2,4,6-trideoxy-beta-L-altropyranose hydrolase [Colwellia ponticola]
MKTIVFRADASPVLATGHIMRCLTLAQALTLQFPLARIIFISNHLPNSLTVKLMQLSVELVTLPFDIDSSDWRQTDDAKACINAITSQVLTVNTTIDLLIVDHYFIDWQWQKELKQYYKKLLVIDDLANRTHLADFLLDQTLNRQTNDYLSLVPPYCQLLLGKKFILLRDEFSRLIPTAKQKRAQVKTIKNTISIDNILVNLGGLDNNNLTKVIINALIEYKIKTNNHKLTVDIIMASHSPHVESIKALITDHDWLTLTLDCNEMSNKILNADLAIGACGTTAWERCSLGLPTLAIVLADNQKEVNNSLADEKAIISLGHYQALTMNAIIEAICLLESQPSNYLSLIKNSFNSCDGLGIQRVVTQLSTPEVTLELATINDLPTVFNWQSNPQIRHYSRNTKAIKYQEHKQWFLSSISMEHRHMYMVCSAGKKLGVLRLDKQNIAQSVKRYEISILIAPEAQRKKLALKAIHAIPKSFDSCEIYAHVHPQNQASQHLFTQVNFIKLTESSYLRPSYHPPSN